MSSLITDLAKALGLLWERTHLVGFTRVRAPGMHARWTQDLEPIGDRRVAEGELVELVVTIDPPATLVAGTPLRLDILEEDWFFTGGLDDQVVSLTGPGAQAPDGVPAEDRLVSEVVLAEGEDLAEAVDSYRLRQAPYHDRGLLVVRPRPGGPAGPTTLIGWWRARRVEELWSDPELYFVADIAGVRHATQDTLVVDAAPPGTAVRLLGTIQDDEPEDRGEAQRVPEAVVTLGGRTATSDAEGEYLLDVRLPYGTHELTVARPGIDTRTLAVDVAETPSGGRSIVVRELPEGGAEVLRHVEEPPLEHSALIAVLDLRVHVHKVRGTVTWPDSRDPAEGYGGTPLEGKRVYVLPLAPGATAPQRPSSTHEWEALQRRPGVLRSARPGRARLGEPTEADGEFEVSFVDLTPGSSHLVWVTSLDERSTPRADLTEVVVRTARVTGMREMDRGFASPLHRVTRHLVDSSYNLTTPGVAWALDSLRVVSWEADPANPDPETAEPRAIRPRAGAVADYDADPIGGTHRVERLTFDDDAKRVTGLRLQALPLVPVDEAPDARSRAASQALTGLGEALEHERDFSQHGYLLGGLRWVLDARRIATSGWNTNAACALLEDTFLTRPTLPAGTLDNAAWNWWRIDAVTLADNARVTIGAAATFASRVLASEWVPVLAPGMPRLLGLFPGRHLYLAPGHGLFAEPPLTEQAAQWRSAREGWNVRAGEDENNAVMAMEVLRIARANDLEVTVCRELEDLTAPGVVQTAASVFAESTNADFPRLWQQSTYYYLAHAVEPHEAPPHVVTGTNLGNGTLSNNATDPNRMRKNIDSILARIAQARNAAAAARPIDVFLAIHTNGGGEAARGTMTLFLDVRQTRDAAAPGQAGYVETNLLGRAFAQRLQAAVRARCGTPAFGDGTVRYWTNNNPIADLRDTFPHFRETTANNTAPAVRTIRSREEGAGLAWFNWPREIPVALSEVAFHSHAEDGRLLSRDWFRRQAAEGMAMATEATLRAAAGAVTQADVAGVLRRAFGGTAPVVALPTGTAASTVEQTGAAVLAVTGRDVTPGGTTLDHLVVAVRAAATGYTRQQFAEALRGALAVATGWDPGPAAEGSPVDRFVAGPMVRGAGIAALGRPGRPCTRAEAAGLVGNGIGLRPADLATLTTPLGGGGVQLIETLTGPEQPEAWLTQRDGAAIVARVARLRPQDCYHLRSVAVVDARQRPLGSGAPALVRLRRGRSVRLVAETAGVSWRAQAADVTFRVRDNARATVASLGALAPEPERLVSAQWTPDMAGTGPHELTVEVLVRHRTAGVLPIGDATVRIEFQ